MLSKSRSHVLCVATVFHVLFMIDEAYVKADVTKGDEDRVSERAIKAAISFVSYSCQQVAYIAGKMSLTDEKEKNGSGMIWKCYVTHTEL